ncbi:Major facilitator superfamily domain general substrate transporter [Penicillium cataractarum]|uniref:Major facilitator superfamily domain general substrate transporter n=1 Tax=Penicillium cataractarum TaxID=2100454 RepID=A0A9W9RRB3_9EURO|nr:Major facilitator superfamily domain general substrate transporter [Penicillium cataractarum]KAJ5364245.1 Major facilitator superfamily domain general substrate transporter [Penicillium cataractarum]
MSTTQILHPEAKSATVSSPRPAMMASPESSFPSTPAQEVTVEFPSNFGGPSPAPRAGQTVFERIPSAKVTQSRRVLVTTLLILANLVQMTVNFAGTAGGRTLTQSMGVKPTYASWVGASYGLTQGTFVLISGRLGDVYGYRKLVLAGGAWLSIATLASAFCGKAFFAFLTMRALASAPMGGYFGALFLGAFMEKTDWKWFFVFTSGLGIAVSLAIWLLSMRETPVDQHGKIDYVGSALGTTSLILFNFVWNQAPSVGWQTPYEIVLLIISIILFGAFLVWEKRYTSHPIMPLEIFKAPSFLTVLLVVLLNYMAVGTLIWYQVLWLQEVWKWSPLQFAVGWTPFVICATAAACLAAWLVPRLAAQWILAIGTCTILISNALMATVPVSQSYWAQVFPSVVLFAFCPDFVYTAGQIIASNSVRRHQQGIAGSIVGTLNLYGNSLGLGFASTIEVQSAKRSGSQIIGYRSALYFGVAISVIALILDVGFVRLVKDNREGWGEEDRLRIEEIELAQYAEASGANPHAVVERP